MKSKEPQNNWIFQNQERLFELHTEGIKQQEQWLVLYEVQFTTNPKLPSQALKLSLLALI
jgi:hypothetical protein